MFLHNFIKSVLQNNKLKQEENKKDNNDITQKSIRVINENGVEMVENQFQHRTQGNKALIPINDENPSVYHYWYDCYEDWPLEFVKNFIGWKIQDIESLTDCRECKRCMERDYRNAHPNAIITGYDFHYYFEDI